MTADGWRFWVDRGGTFTDVVGVGPDGRLVTRKLLSEAPGRYDDAVVAGIRALLGLGDGDPIPDRMIESVRVGTTVTVNALLERSGDPTALVITQGFRDALRIAYQNRPRIFDRHIVLPEPLYRRVIESTGRVTATGEVLAEPDLDRLAEELQSAKDDGITTVAIACLHGHLFGDQERRIADVAGRVGFSHVSLSSEISPLIKLVSRADTTVVDAYLSPTLTRYVRQVDEQLGDTALQFMQSSGGLVDASRFRAAESLLSGPAGGVVGTARMAELSGFRRAIGFDMGGTSTDVAHYAGEFQRVFDTSIAGVRIRTPMLAIHTVAAGGGSILGFDGRRYQVGPDSAGADPGPACYRLGGPLTVTDANLMLGRIRVEHLPSVFGPDRDQPADLDVVRTLFAELADNIRTATGDRRTPEEVAAGYLKIAVENMANAVKQISVHQGHDVTRYALVAFGGAGGQHACAVADALGIRTVVVPPLASLLSAVGIGLADESIIRQQAVERPLTGEVLADLSPLTEALAEDARAELGGTGRGGADIVRTARLRYDGTDTALAVPLTDLDRMIGEFSDRHRQLYGFTMERQLIIEAVAVECRSAAMPAEQLDWSQTPGRSGPAPDRSAVDIWIGGSRQRAEQRDRSGLTPADRVDGPAMITEADTTTVVEPGWSASVDEHGALVLRRSSEPDSSDDDQQRDADQSADPVLLEIFNNLFMSVAEQMGAQLQSTAQSVNIKERLDFSCALFDPDGRLVANAPHIPVHLGSMGSSVREVIKRRTADLRPGDMFAVNDPYHGGTHLPDVTVIAPVFDADHTKIIFYVASRGHHAEIGGISPGSMPATSRTLDEEGVLFDNWLLVRDGRFLEAETRELLTGARYPSRSPEVNLADLRAQVAANHRGIGEIAELIDEFGLDTVHRYMHHVQDHAEESVREVIDRLDGGSFRYRTDGGAVIMVTISIDRRERSATIDFTGTSPQLATNFNAPSSVARAAVLYVFRTLVDHDIPLNDGCLRPLKIIIEEGSMLAPAYPAAVVAGNVETSQAITGALYGALGIQAEGSGTMNNVTFGNDRVQYYETVASGSGAGDGFDGVPAVQTHMTNSRLTDPEVLESRFPVLLEEFRIRTGSGGRGRWSGGDGAVRRMQFTEPMTVTVLSGHRRVPPYGVAGGEPGALGHNRVVRADGSTEELGSTASVRLEAGDRWVIETPGGGGFGARVTD
ncbi:MAG: hydantoinase B/oxoprolinase family protein [Microlunatus sp.]|nr:hydantoinase B/oxoprolinase family protein [Microlunatus sp.]